MKLRLVMCAVLASLPLLQSAAGAQSDRPVKIGIGGGLSVPVSDAKNSLKNGFHGELMVMWAGEGLPIGVRGSVGYERLTLKGLASGTDGDTRILSGIGNLSLGFPVGPVKPYIIAGLGAFNAQKSVSGISSPSKTKFGIDAGAGLEFKLGGILGFVEGKFQNVFSDQGFSSALGSAKAFSTQIIPVTFGVFF